MLMVSLLAIYFLLLSSSSSPIVFVLNCVDAFYAGREKKSDSFLYSCSARQHIPWATSICYSGNGPAYFWDFFHNNFEYKIQKNYKT